MGVHSSTLRIVGHLARFLKASPDRLRITGTGRLVRASSAQVKGKGVQREGKGWMRAKGVVG